ncbi:MAG: hypothetical protein RRY53_02035, partial [Pseudoflavonifractor sp.]
MEQGDSPFLFTVGSAMTTRDALAFQTFTLTAETDENGTVTDAGANKVAPRSSKTFTFTPNPGCTAGGVTVNGVPVAAENGSYTFETVVADATL